MYSGIIKVFYGALNEINYKIIYFVSKSVQHSELINIMNKNSCYF